jgi:septum formation protein
MLLQRLGLPFRTFRPEVDETPLADEAPAALVQRLAVLKAAAAQPLYPHALVIGSDQVAHCQGRILGKPGSEEKAQAQLRWLSGQVVEFLTGVCVLNTAHQTQQVALVTVTVKYRQLNESQITQYLQREEALQCAASFRSEGLGSALVEYMRCDDPSALIGLPLIALVRLLEQEGVSVL